MSSMAQLLRDVLMDIVKMKKHRVLTWRLLYYLTEPHMSSHLTVGGRLTYCHSTVNLKKNTPPFLCSQGSNKNRWQLK